jgi:hypothetical protein
MECRNGSPFGLEPMGVVTQLVADALAPPGHVRFARLRPGGAWALALGGQELGRGKRGLAGEAAVADELFASPGAAGGGCMIQPASLAQAGLPASGRLMMHLGLDKRRPEEG